MSEEFLKVARQEIGEDLESIDKILSGCKNDGDILKNSVSLEKIFHKIKGLAPMMDQNEMGTIAKQIDSILKHVIANGILDGTYAVLTESHRIMREILDGSEAKDVEKILEKIKATFPKVLS